MITVRLKNEQFEFGKIFSSGQLKLLHYLELENFRESKSIFFSIHKPKFFSPKLLVPIQSIANAQLFPKFVWG